MSGFQIGSYAPFVDFEVLQMFAELFDVSEDRIEETAVELFRELMRRVVLASQRPLPFFYFKNFKRPTDLLNNWTS